MTKRPSLLTRLNRSLGPIAAALILDSVDLITFGPLGLIGLFLGFGVGYWLGVVNGFQTKGRFICAVLSGIYCLIPLTAPFPVATIISAIARFVRCEAISDDQSVD